MQKNSKALLKAENLNIEKLKELALCCADVCKLPKDKVQFYKYHPVQIFDFSTRARGMISMKILALTVDDSNDNDNNSSGDALRGIVVDGTVKSFSNIENNLVGKGSLVFPVGDAIMEPFWPQGLGMNRGVHTCLNAVYAALVFRESNGNMKLSVQESDFAYSALRWQTFYQGSVVTEHKFWTIDYVDRFQDSIFKDLMKEKKKKRKPR